MTNTLILFGAGASFGSDTMGTPPLGTSLLEALQASNPAGWGSLPDSLADAFREDFENAMRQLSKSHPHWMPILQRAMAAYFFRFAPSESSLYVGLARRMKRRRWKGAIATLNYERLIELSLMHSSLQPHVGGPPRTNNSIELCLLHGCCHLFCESVRGRSNAVTFSGAAVRTSGPIKVISDPAEFRVRIESDAFPPVMSYFDPKKETTSGTNFIEQQRQRWRDLAKHATPIIIVGVRVRPHDNHIWDPIADAPGKIVYCSGPSSAADYEDWRVRARPHSEDLAVPEYFDGAFDSICSELGLDD